jgi:hypothetical protein
MSLGIILSKYTILIIIKFASFNLTSAQFLRQSIAAIIIGLLGLVLYLAGQDFADCIFVGVETAVSVGICIYVVVIRGRVRREEVGERKRPGMGEVGLERGCEV